MSKQTSYEKPNTARKKRVTVSYKCELRALPTLFENESITDINYPELLTAFYHYII